jgi:hypothetical protein
MDKVGTNTTKRRAKVIARAEEMMRHFQITPEGDRKMNMHIMHALLPEQMVSCNCCGVGRPKRFIVGVGGERSLLCVEYS